MMILKNNYNNNKQNTYNSREEKKTIILIYYIQTMKRLPCLICSVNITFIKTKRGICFQFMVPVQFFFKILPFRHGLLL